MILSFVLHGTNHFSASNRSLKSKSNPKMEENLKMGQGIISRDGISLFFFVVCVCVLLFVVNCATPLCFFASQGEQRAAREIC